MKEDDDEIHGRYGRDENKKLGISRYELEDRKEGAQGMKAMLIITSNRKSRRKVGEVYQIYNQKIGRKENK